VTCAGLATAWAGPTAALTATVLIASAATMATRVRVNCDCDDIFNLPFWSACLIREPMLLAIQGLCQSRKTAENSIEWPELVDFADQQLVEFAKARSGTFTNLGASNPNR
jgi:hypothetical protein